MFDLSLEVLRVVEDAAVGRDADLSVGIRDPAKIYITQELALAAGSSSPPAASPMATCLGGPLFRRWRPHPIHRDDPHARATWKPDVKVPFR